MGSPAKLVELVDDRDSAVAAVSQAPTDSKSERPAEAHVPVVNSW